MKGVDILKLNAGELELLTGWFSGYRSEKDRIEALQDQFQIPTIVLTKGSQGSLMNMNGVVYAHPGFTVDVADTVGSGDAFLAGLLYSVAQGISPPDAIEFASAMGALIASYAGSCPDYEKEEVNKLILK
jgi:fructokinase